MAEIDQILVTPSPVPSPKPLGDRIQTNLEASYGQSPIYTGELNDEERAELYQEDCLDGVHSGHGINNFSRDFKGTSENPVPDVAGNSETVDGKGFGDGQGAPTTAYIPPLTSPGPGSVSANDQPAYTGTTPDPASNVEFGSGLGGLTNPGGTAGTAQSISQQTLLSDYISGRSYGGSAG